MLFRISKLFLYASVFFIAIVSTSTLFPFIVGKYVWFRTCVDLALIFFALGLLFDAQGPLFVKRLQELYKTPLVIAVTVFTAVFLLAGFTGANPSFSFWSNFERGEGGVQILHLFLFFLLLTLLFQEKSNWKKIFWCSIVAAVLMVAYGIGAGLKVDGFVGAPFSDPGFRFAGSIGNPAYVATYLVFILFYSLYLLLEGYRLKKFFSVTMWVAAAASLLFLIFFFLAATRGAFVGLIAGVVVGLGYVAYADRRLRKWLIGISCGLILAVSILVWQRDAGFIQRSPVGRIFDISFSTQTFRDRATMWKIAWDGFLEKPILGWGPENFQYVFDRHFNTEYFKPAEGFGAWFDRAHSVFFDYLVSAGIVGAASYLGMYVILYIQLFQKTRLSARALAKGNQAQAEHAPRIVREGVNIRALIVALPVIYLVQGLVLFDVLSIYVNIFLFLAFATWGLSPSLRQTRGTAPRTL
jgi:O-antigen ligase